jgi:hypothetical protein
MRCDLFCRDDSAGHLGNGCPSPYSKYTQLFKHVLTKASAESWWCLCLLSALALAANTKRNRTIIGVVVGLPLVLAVSAGFLYCLKVRNRYLSDCVTRLLRVVPLGVVVLPSCAERPVSLFTLLLLAALRLPLAEAPPLVAGFGQEGPRCGRWPCGPGLDRWNRRGPRPERRAGPCPRRRQPGVTAHRLGLIIRFPPCVLRAALDAFTSFASSAFLFALHL